MKALWFVVLSLVSLHAASQPPASDLALRATSVELLYTVRLSGATDCTVRFTKVDAEMSFDPTDPTRTQLRARVDPAAVEIVAIPAGRSREQAVAEMLGPVFLNVAAFPRLELSSKAVRTTGEKTAQLDAELSMLGVRQPLVLNVRLDDLQRLPDGKTLARFSARGQLLRSAYGMTGGPSWSDDVRIAINASFSSR